MSRSRTLRMRSPKSGSRRRSGDVTWGIEGGGAYGRLFADFLVAAGAAVYEIPARLTKRHRKHGSRAGKSDAIDARAIAEVLLRELDRLGHYYGDSIHEELRLHYEHRDRLVGERSQVINRLLVAAFRLQPGDLPRDLYRAKAIRLIRRRAAQIEPTTSIAAALLKEVRFALAAMELYNEQIEEVEVDIRPLPDRFPQLLAMTGISDIVAARVIGHTGDLRNCRDADALAMRSGTAPVPSSSGRRDRLCLNKGGNRQLNRLIHVMAVVQRRIADHPGQLYYRKKLREGKSPNNTLRALKRRLARIVYYRLRADYAAVNIPPPIQSIAA